MKKNLLFLLIVLVSFLKLNATHIVGGFMSYTYVSGTTYKISLTIYRDCTSATYFDQPAYIGIYNASTNAYVEEVTTSNLDTTTLQLNNLNSCLEVSNSICRQQGIYTFEITLPSATIGYIVTYQRCCRNATINNIVDPSGTGETIFAYIPPTATYANNSPVFKNYPPIYICVQQPLSFDHSATDADGDVLRYSLCAPYAGANTANPEPTPPSKPPYSTVTWLSPYSLANVLGGVPLAIDSITGLLTGKPNQIGQYVVGVCVSEYRNGQMINTYLRDFQFIVTECSLPVAKIPSTDINPSTGIGTFVTDCKSRTINFQNSSYYPSGNVTLNYQWNFGVPGITTDTSTSQFPSYTYPDTGTYEVQLIGVKGDSSSQCTDTARAFVKVYPYFNANFTAQDTCAGGPVVFTDSTTSTYGAINQWSWNFGDNSASSIQNPQHSYSSAGNFQVVEIVSSSIGCTDTAVKTVVSYYTADNVISSTTACAGTPVNFTSQPETNYRWSFGGAATSSQQNPSYTFTTGGKYAVSLISQTAKGCLDSIANTVNVHPAPVVAVSNDTTICPASSVSLFASGGKTYTWAPVTGLSAPDSASTVATPSSGITTVYKVQVADSNHCTATDSVTISFFSPALVKAGPDTLVCFNLTGNDTIQLYASGGTSYTWDRAVGLSSTTIPNPVVIISSSGTFIYPVTIVDQHSCTRMDTAQVSIYPVPVDSITADKTQFCPGGSAQICAVPGFASYQWNTGEQSGVCIVAQQSNTYYVIVTNNNGCAARSNMITITMYPVPVDSISGGNSIFCPNDSALLCNSGNFASYLWNTGETSKCIEAKEAGDYYVIVTDNNSCTAQSDHQPISVYPAPSVSIIVEGQQLSSYGAVNYQWYLNDTPILNATSDTFLVNQPGAYSLGVTDNNGCSTLSDPVNMVSTGIGQLAEDDVLLYPNPNSAGNWQLSVNNELMGSALTVYDAQGQIVYQSEIQATRSEIILNVAAGVYWLRISSANTSIVRKLMKL